MTNTSRVRAAPPRRPPEFLPTERAAAWRRRGAFWLPVSPVALCYLALFAVPVLGLLAISFGDTTPGGDIRFTWSPAQYTAFFSDPYYLKILGRTMVSTFWVLAICLVLGYPTAWVISRARPMYQGLALAVLFVPLLTDENVRTLGLLALMSREGVVNRALTAIGFSGEPLHLIGTQLGMNIGLAVLYLPWLVLPLYAFLTNLDTTPIRASYSLGAPQVRTFLKVTLPLSAPGLLAGSVLVVTHVITAFVAPTLIGSAHVTTMSLLTIQNVDRGSWSFAAAVTVILLVLTILPLVVFSRLLTMARPDRVRRRRSRAARRSGYARVNLFVMRFLPELRVPAFVIRAIAVLTVVLVLSPLFMVVVTAFSTSRALAFPPPGLTLDWFTEAFARSGYWENLRTSVVIAVVVAVISVALGFTAALATARQRLYRPETVTNLFLTPLLVPNIALSLALLKLVNLLNVPTGTTILVLAHLMLTLPFTIRIISADLYNMNWSLVDASYSLGAPRVRTFWKVVLPTLKPSLMISFVFALIVSFINVGMSIFLTAPGEVTLPIFLFSQLESGYAVNSAAAFSVLLIGISVLVTLLFYRSVGLQRVARH